jgi:hypothetical protein
VRGTGRKRTCQRRVSDDQHADHAWVSPEIVRRKVNVLICAPPHPPAHPRTSMQRRNRFAA